ncbi:hypothetical protein [Pseudozobellia thermophila]|uniref:hypothetical protein n=1 Tax=Pseudozobellia thermophila TaxID=192903 RepID=UPI00147E0BEC|nr:hypothetical protein [Pseudozobellia thermophila]
MGPKIRQFDAKFNDKGQFHVPFPISNKPYKAVRFDMGQAYPLAEKGVGRAKPLKADGF